jgi:hypothetical protein
VSRRVRLRFLGLRLRRIEVHDAGAAEEVFTIERANANGHVTALVISPLLQMDVESITALKPESVR